MANLMMPQGETRDHGRRHIMRSRHCLSKQLTTLWKVDQTVFFCNMR